MPFGYGPRNCIGMRFALLEAKMALIEIVSKFRIVLAPETKVTITIVIVYVTQHGALWPCWHGWDYTACIQQCARLHLCDESQFLQYSRAVITIDWPLLGSLNIHRSHCLGNMHLYTALKYHRPRSVLRGPAKSVDTLGGSAWECI